MVFTRGVFAILLLIGCAVGQENLVKFVLIYENGQDKFISIFEEWLRTNNIGNPFDLIPVKLEEDANVFDQLCSGYSQGGTITLDISWSGYDVIRNIAKDMNIPYVKIDVSISPFLRILDNYLDARNSTDAALIFENPELVDQTLYYWIDSTQLRMVITEKLDTKSAKRLRDMRPSPNHYVLLGTSAQMMSLYNQANSEQLLQLPERWNLLLIDFDHQSIYRENLYPAVNIIYPEKSMCCSLTSHMDCQCATTQNLLENFVESTLKILQNVVRNMQRNGQDMSGKVECNSSTFDEGVQDYFYKSFADAIMLSDAIMYENDVVWVRSIGKIEVINKQGQGDVVAQYVEGENIEVLMPDLVKPVKPFYRIGTTYSKPWSYTEIDPDTGKEYWTGYCLDFAQKLSELMNFDYEIVIPAEGTFGKKDRYGNWNGVIGDLATGKTDIAIAALTMTADREEVVDFVAPYFEQVGISIVMRKPIRRTSLFKFMTVLKLEVWMSIVGALIVTGFMVWFLDKYSPYSARNNKTAYPYPCRHFNLKESFWFALTSFTPQGGGEAPKALSGRTLVASYWLFVVLMLATFTANLAAFLTVERMQTPVQSLEQLARQSRINYTVVEGSETHKYFINMKHAEDTLYRMWKELTLNASTDETIYRVWDYPIREQYGQILIAINDSMPLATAEDGFKKVNEHIDADFAFIHDSSEIKYAMSRSCNFTEIGEVFGEKPYAVAVQQGSHLQDTISIKILDLQNDRFFESLQAKYWNHSAKGDCDNADDNEGITLESLGGVFIATLFGLALAMITLAGEVIYYKRKQKVEEIKSKNKAKDMAEKIELSKFPKPGGKGMITIGDAFKPVTDKDALRMSHIALYPRNRNRLPVIE